MIARFNSGAAQMIQLLCSAIQILKTPPISLLTKQVDVQVVDDYSSRSCRLLAGAVGVIRGVHKLDIACMTQQQVESCATQMQLLSLVVLTNSLRTDSRQTISQIQEG